MDSSESLKLENQLCFRFYSVSKLMNRHYNFALKKLGLTYSQYLVMLVLWEIYANSNDKDPGNNAITGISVKQLDERLDLDSGTLSPLLKRLEKQTMITRFRNGEDERIVEVKLTASGARLKEQAQDIPAQMFAVTGMSINELQALKNQLDNLLDTMAS